MTYDGKENSSATESAICRATCSYHAFCKRTHKITDEDINEEYERSDVADANSDDSEVHDELRPTPCTIEVQAAMDVSQWYSRYPESTDVAKQVTRACSSIDAAIAQQKKEVKITDFC